LIRDTTIIHGTLNKLLLNATAVSDLKNTLWKKKTMQKSEYGAQSPKRLTRYPQYCVVNISQKLHYKYSLTFDDLHQNALPGIPVPE
jgi:hypothetical protein